MDEAAPDKARRRTWLRNLVLAVAAQGLLLVALIVLFNEPAGTATTVLIVPDSVSTANGTLRLQVLVTVPAGSHLPVDNIEVLVAAGPTYLDDAGHLVDPVCHATLTGQPRVALRDRIGAPSSHAAFTASVPAVLQTPEGFAYGTPRPLDLDEYDNGAGPGAGQGVGGNTPGPDAVALLLEVQGCPQGPAAMPLALQVLVGAPGQTAASLPFFFYA